MKEISQHYPTALVDKRKAHMASKLANSIDTRLHNLQKSAAGKLSIRPARSFLKSKSLTKVIIGSEKSNAERAHKD